MCNDYLNKYHSDDISKILQSIECDKCFSININFISLFDENPPLGNKVLEDPEVALKNLEEAAHKIQAELFSKTPKGNFIKSKIRCRIHSLPECPELHRHSIPKNGDVGKFLQITGTVTRISTSKILAYKRVYICTKCKFKITCEAQYIQMNIIIAPKQCANPESCPGTNFIESKEAQSDCYKDYQEIRIQEQISQLDFGTMPHSINVTLEDDLVDSCKPGDDVTICGIIYQRWFHATPGTKCKIELWIKANHIQINNIQGLTSVIKPDIEETFSQFWNTYKDNRVAGRNFILQSFCPEIYGFYIIKLALAVVLAAGNGGHSDRDDSTNVHTRSEPHLLLVGDPGTGKSQLLRFASKIASRSVLTTGVGSTAAGLTVAAIMENGEWQLEGGALVLADGGICCIDEFSSMKERDRTSIHEAMEQQTISVAKAGIVCKLSTKCSILAATNPKQILDPTQPLSLYLALPSPLLSRFDLILLVKDEVDDKWDDLVADFILNHQDHDKSNHETTTTNEWDLETLRSYFSTIKKLNPRLSEAANDILGTYYQLQRKNNSRNKSRTTVRLLDSLVRLSRGHARLLYHDTIEIIDAITSVLLMEVGMGSPEDSVLALNLNIQEDFPEDPVGSYQNLMQLILKKLNLSHLWDLEKRQTQTKKPDNTENVESEIIKEEKNMFEEEFCVEDLDLRM